MHELFTKSCWVSNVRLKLNFALVNPIYIERLALAQNTSPKEKPWAKAFQACIKLFIYKNAEIDSPLKTKEENNNIEQNIFLHLNCTVPKYQTLALPLITDSRKTTS